MKYNPIRRRKHLELMNATWYGGMRRLKRAMRATSKLISNAILQSKPKPKPMQPNDETPDEMPRMNRAFIEDLRSQNSAREFQKEYLSEPNREYPNDYNRELPPIPAGYGSWREVYAIALGGLAKYNPAPWHSSFVVFEHNGELRPPAENEIAGLRYTEVAHYAAREQAAQDAEVAPFDLMELQMLVGSAMLPAEMMQRLRLMMQAAYRKERNRNRPTKKPRNYRGF